MLKTNEEVNQLFKWKKTKFDVPLNCR